LGPANLRVANTVKCKQKDIAIAALQGTRWLSAEPRSEWTVKNQRGCNVCPFFLLCADAPLRRLAALIGMCTLCLLWLLAVVLCAPLHVLVCLCVGCGCVAPVRFSNVQVVVGARLGCFCAALLRRCAAALLLVCHCIVLHRCGVVRLHFRRCAAVRLRCC